jgi:hypothetical protein
MTAYTVTEAQFEQLLTIAKLFAQVYPYPKGETK